MSEKDLSKNRKVPNTFGSVPAALKNVTAPDKSASLASDFEKTSPKELKAASKKLVECIKQMFADNRSYDAKLDAKTIDQIVGRITSVMNDAFSCSVSKDDIDALKKDVVDGVKAELGEQFIKSVVGQIIMSQFNSMLDDHATKEDISELKLWIKDNLPSTETAEVARSESSEIAVKDEKKGKYVDSAPAENFYTMQEYIGKQFKQMNKAISNITVHTGLIRRMFGVVGKGFSKVFSGVGKCAKLTAKVVGGVASLTAFAAKGLFTGVSKIVGGISKGIGFVIGGIAGLAKGVGGLAKGVGNFIASPFKKIGGFFKSLNPFSKAKEKAEERKEKAKNKVFDVIAKILDKVWNAIEPFVEKVLMFLPLITMGVIVPIALIVAKVMLITAAIIALGVGLYLAYKLVKEKALELWEYITGGKLWEDIKSGLLKLWEWTKDFGKWIWDKLCQFGKWYLKTLVKVWKFMFIDVPLWIWDKLCDFGVWLWDKLCEFGKWLYDNYIDKYLVQPFMKYVWNPLKELWENKVWPVIEPFVKSLSELKDKIVQAFSAWDTNKSIWENLKNISGIIVDAVVEWWDKSPFKAFYEKYLEPHIQSLGNLIQRIKTIWSKFKWDENKSFLDNLKGLASTIKEGVLEWWRDENNPIRKFYNEHIKPIIDKIKDVISPIIEKIKQIWNSIKIKLSKVYIHIPVWDKDIYPFAALVDEPFLRNGGESAADAKARTDKENIDDKLAKIAKLKHDIATNNYIGFEGRKKRRAQEDREEVAKLEKEIEDYKKSQIESKDLAQQQMAKPIEQVDSIGNMNTQNAENLAATSSAMSAKVEQKEQQQQQRWQQNDALQYSILKELKDTRAEVNKYGKDPAAVPVPMPYGPVKNRAVIDEAEYEGW